MCYDTFMKFTKTEAFEKHLEEALPEHPSPLYGVALADPFEREFVIRRLIGQIGGEVKWMRASETPSEVFLEEIDSPSLFASKRTLIYDEVKKGEELQAALKHLPEGVHVILGGSSFRLYEGLKKEMVLLDLSGEKPWERTSRLKRWLLQEVQKKGKSLTSDAAAYLSEFCSAHFESLLQEIEKLITYAGDQKEIDLHAVRALIALQPAQKGWQLSESIIWGGEVHFPTLHRLDFSELYLFLGQLRYQIQLGLIVASCLERGEEKAIEKEYPKLPYQALDKYKRLAASLKTSYFRERLHELFQLECATRTQASRTRFLLDRFVALCQVGRSHG